MDEKNIKYHDCVRKNYIRDISKNIDQCIKHKAMLSFKNDHLSFIVNVVQISIIIISATLTIMESIKSYYNVESAAIDIITILFTAFITLIMAIYRFFKMDEQKEKICNLIENYTFIINKFQRTLKKMKTFVIRKDNENEWTTILSNYEDEILENYISIKENFDNTFTYKDIIYYKNKYKKLFLKQEFINNEIDIIHYFKRSEPHSKYIIENEGKNCLKSKKKIDYENFIKTNEYKYIQHHEKWEKDKKRNQDLYNKYVLGHDIPCGYYDKYGDDYYFRDDLRLGNPTDSNPTDGNPTDSNPDDSNLGDSNPTDSNPGDNNPDDSNLGDSNTGDNNSLDNADRPRMVIETEIP